jgi:hypothetical protein
MRPPTDNSRGIYRALAVLVSAVLAGILWYGAFLEVQEGIIHHKGGGGFLKANDPVRFWIDVGIQIAIGLGFGVLSLWLALGRQR